MLVAYLQLREAELDGVLRRAVTGLAPGGVLLVLGHDVTNLIEGTGGPPDPAVLYTPESIVRSLGHSPWCGPSESGVLSPPLTATARRWTPGPRLAGLTTVRERPVTNRRTGCSASAAG